MIDVKKLLGALGKAAAVLSGAQAAFDEVKGLAESVREVVGESDKAKIDTALAELQTENDEDFARVSAKLAAASQT